MKLQDSVWGLLCILLGATVLIYVQSFPAMPGQRYGPAVFPGLIAAGFVVCGLILVVRGLKTGEPLFTRESWTRSGAMITRLLAVCAAILFYLYASEPLGFLITSFLLLFALFWIFGVPLKRGAIIAIVTTFAIHLLFYKVMRVPLPWGILTGMAW